MSFSYTHCNIEQETMHDYFCNNIIHFIINNKNCVRQDTVHITVHILLLIIKTVSDKTQY